jgi:hypothetical protein
MESDPDSGDDIASESMLATAASAPPLISLRESPRKAKDQKGKDKKEKRPRESILSSNSTSERVETALKADLKGHGKSFFEECSVGELEQLYTTLDLKPDKSEYVSALLRYKAQKKSKVPKKKKTELAIVNRHISDLSLKKLKTLLEPLGVPGGSKEVLIRNLLDMIESDTKLPAVSRRLQNKALYTICNTSGIYCVKNDTRDILISRILGGSDTEKY